MTFCIPDESDEFGLECSICLQPCIHPVQLPCTHIFCYLCVKGVANQSKKCALCRQEIPADFLNNPVLLRKEELDKELAFEGGYQWFYEGNRGWWQYDERASREIEERFQKGTKAFEILIAGFLYVVDMEHMFQYRRNDPTRRRRIKRDHTDIPDRKGVAGLQVANKTCVRKEGDGGEVDNTPRAPPPAAPPAGSQPPPLPPRGSVPPRHPNPSIPNGITAPVSNPARTENSPSSTSLNVNNNSHSHSPESPGLIDSNVVHNSPQTPDNEESDSDDRDDDANSAEADGEGTEDGEDLVERMSNLRLRRSRYQGQLHIPSRNSRPMHELTGYNSRMRFLRSPSSSDSEWD